MDLAGKDIISGKQFTKEDLEYIMDYSVKIEKNKDAYDNILKGKILATLFFEPSTRTRLSFESAMYRLGGNVLGFHSAAVSSVKKGETIADTMRTVSNYADAIVIRHSVEGAATLAAKFASVPIINAGSGPGEHPTQGLLDLLAIREEFGKIDGLSIGLIGDLKYGRTVHSLSILLSNYDVNLYLISPDALRMQYRVMDFLQRKGIKLKETKRFKTTLPLLDVIYMTRIQKERFPDPEEYEKVKNIFELGKEEVATFKEGAKIMHPLPRITEIKPEIDDSPHSIYFKETYYGLMLRKAILRLILGPKE
ncbi:MAG: aspartate carbamoyltransferase [archaeon]|nr:aspartate carbamoyltransferase [archaeon]